MARSKSFSVPKALTVVEALGHSVTHAPEDKLRAHVAAHGSELAMLVSARASRIPEESRQMPDTQQMKTDAMASTT